MTEGWCNTKFQFQPVLDWRDFRRHGGANLGMVKDGAELAALEEHMLACASCAARVDEAQDYVDAIRVGAIILSETGEIH